MPDRFDSDWLDALAGRADAAEAARLADRLGADPAAAAAFASWRRLAAAVHANAAERAHDPPSLDAVLLAIRTPAGTGTGATPLDAAGRATLRRLSAEPLVPAAAPRPVPAWAVGAAAVAAAVMLALWPTSRGPLGGVFLDAVRRHAPVLADMPAAAPSQPTAIARRGSPGARLRVGAASADGSPIASVGGAAAAAGYLALGPDGGLGGLIDPVAGGGAARWVGGATGARAAARRGAIRAGSSAGAAGGGGAPGAPLAVASATVGAGYPRPLAQSPAYPPPAPPAPTGRDGGGKRSPKPTSAPPDTATPVPTVPPADTATPTPAATAPPAFTGVTGRITGPDGGGRAQVRIAAYRADDAPIARSWVEAFTADASGRYTLTLAAGTWQLFVEAPGHRPQWWPGADRPEGAQADSIADGTTLTRDWRLAAVDGNDGLLVGQTGPNAWVRAVNEGDDPTATGGPSTLADSAGRFALPLAAGRWAVARADEGRDRGWWALPEAVTVEGGTSTTVAWP